MPILTESTVTGLSDVFGISTSNSSAVSSSGLSLDASDGDEVDDDSFFFAAASRSACSSLIFSF